MWQLYSLVAQMVKNLPAMRETWVQFLGWEDPLEEGTAAHSIILAWSSPWTEEAGWLQSMGSQRVRHDWVTTYTQHIHYEMTISINLITICPHVSFYINNTMTKNTYSLCCKSYPQISFLIYYRVYACILPLSIWPLNAFPSGNHHFFYVCMNLILIYYFF